MQTIAFETMQFALEATRGTAIANPTHLLPWAGTLKPMRELYRPSESRGTLAAHYRAKAVRAGSEWEASGDVDPDMMPAIGNLVARGAVTTPSTPGGATLARLWEFARNVTGDTLKSATVWWGDPNVQTFLSDYCMADEITFKNDASGSGVLTGSIKGKGGVVSKVSEPTPAAGISNDVLPGQLMQLWIDTSSAIGTTAVTGRLVSAEHTLPTGRTYKHLAAGPTASLDYSSVGMQRSAPSAKLVLELPDMTQYDLWAASTVLKVRVRHNGALIEAGFYNYVEFDLYAPFDGLAWGTNQTSNRTIELNLKGQYDATLGSDFRMAVQTARATL